MPTRVLNLSKKFGNSIFFLPKKCCQSVDLCARIFAFFNLVGDMIDDKRLNSNEFSNTSKGNPTFQVINIRHKIKRQY